MATNIKKGDKWNFTGAVRYVDMSKLTPNSLKPGGNTDETPVDLRSGTPLNFWTGGFANALWAPTPGVPGGRFSSLPNNGDTQVYANGDMLKSGQVRNTAVLSGGKVTITPVPLNTQEMNLVNASSPPPNKPTHLSACFTTYPFGLKPPYCFGCKVTFPSDMGPNTGDWPAIWMLPTDKSWPPEVDTMDGYNTRNGVTFINSGVVPSNGQSVQQFDLAPFVPGSHIILALVYSDIVAYFIDGVCMGVGPTGIGIELQGGGTAMWYGIINYAIQGKAGGWPSGMPPGKGAFVPMVIEDVYMLGMPATYPGPGDGGAIPIMGNAPTTNFGAAGPTAPVSAVTFPITGTAGTQWINVTAFNGAGVKICPDVKPSGPTGAYTLTCDSTLLTPDATSAVDVIAFSVPPGQSGGLNTKVTIPVTLATPHGVTQAQIDAVKVQVSTAQTALTSAQALLGEMKP